MSHAYSEILPKEFRCSQNFCASDWAVTSVPLVSLFLPMSDIKIYHQQVMRIGLLKKLTAPLESHE